MIGLPGLRRKIDAEMLLAAAFLATYVCLAAIYPIRLLARQVELMRKGVMVDDTICASAGRGVEWRTFDTGYFKVEVERGVDLDAVEAYLRKRFFFAGQSRDAGAGVEAKIGRRLNAICQRAMAMLDMNPKMPKIGVKIFKNREDLFAAYRLLIGDGRQIRAFYAHDCGTVYTSEENISDSVMAHEIAHAIIDNHYNGIPIPKVGEMLASYVDMHLSD